MFLQNTPFTLAGGGVCGPAGGLEVRLFGSRTGAVRMARHFWGKRDFELETQTIRNKGE